MTLCKPLSREVKSVFVTTTTPKQKESHKSSVRNPNVRKKPIPNQTSHWFLTLGSSINSTSSTLIAWCDWLYMAVAFSIPPYFGSGSFNSISLSLDVLGSLTAFLLSPVMLANDFFILLPVEEDLLPELKLLSSLVPTFSRKKYRIGPAMTGMQAQMTPKSLSRPLHSAMSL